MWDITFAVGLWISLLISASVWVTFNYKVGHYHYLLEFELK